MAKDISTKLITGKVRLSYANIWEPRPDNNGNLKYSCAILIPKSDKETLRKYKAIIDALKAEAEARYRGKLPANFKFPLHDGDEERPDDPNYAGHYFINAYSNTKPGIAKPAGKDANGKTKFQEITDSTEVYSGCYARVSLNFYLYDNQSKGIGAGLNNIVKVQDGERLAGTPSVEQDFADEEFDDLDDYGDEDFLA
ncbi:hypothetical protein Alches_17460 [Alicyclobacillus hesperidum subsp. aegles]|uniref:DUF2815 family protein n=1 Tax=Alicyclobacillus hesperidum TaxID=89784 RepID=UPI00222BDB02|nr:DUF2815 family protein [Alicyclobacillus hesperidum]GLG01706.1 hypothetical protein Alches_17460 [Alicyclobacillus hesperidum subsp. aegles]